VTKFLAEDFAHVASLLRHYADANQEKRLIAVLGNNINVIIQALEIAAKEAA
jgi:hypothetical protein